MNIAAMRILYQEVMERIEKAIKNLTKKSAGRL